ncbi:MAG: hypothetical protein BWZ10_02655 [candidate division BRC1 bacterium ADurb.BinA364]|nr:MAG: hypothetical protein BWZ10_02655 [candidate division BRC1 bacterium ADurb.BinA364]
MIGQLIGKVKRRAEGLLRLAKDLDAERPRAARGHVRNRDLIQRGAGFAIACRDAQIGVLGERRILGRERCGFEQGLEGHAMDRGDVQRQAQRRLQGDPAARRHGSLRRAQKRDLAGLQRLHAVARADEESRLEGPACFVRAGQPAAGIVRENHRSGHRIERFGQSGDRRRSRPCRPRVRRQRQGGGDGEWRQWPILPPPQGAAVDFPV